MKASTIASFWGMIMLVASLGCKKSSKPSTPAAPSSTTTLSPTETSLLGNWIYDKQELYNNGVLIPGPGGTYTFNDAAVYHIKFNSTPGPLSQYKECINGTSGSDVTTNWEVTTSGKLYIQSTTYSIDSLTANFLCYYSGSLTTGAAVKYSFHK
ncbi:MAG: hypothetical protein K0R26_1026 [Bacteroidota bacterium]|jgi:hypothetical protein|nr:hypothetical protein [Bacteroidota bacterium]